MNLETNKHYHADWLKHAKTMPDECVDLVATDPPYGYSFMGKDWDKVVLDPKYWRECLRVLKPGGFCFVMSAPRQDVLSKAIINLAEAGFEVGFTPIYWTYASGFPKASNIGKKVDKKLGAEREVVGQRTDGRYKHGFSEEAKKAMGGEVYEHTQGFQGKMGEITEPATDEAKALDGSYGGFQPKPAVEVIIVAMKPLSERTYTDQALANGKGITWLDNCRIPYVSDADKESSRYGSQADIKGGNLTTPTGIIGKDVLASENGRFPANLLVSDDALNDGDITRSGKDNARTKEGFFIEHGGLGKAGDIQVSHNDSGSHSRYFDIDAWWHEQLQDMPDKVLKTFPFLIVPKPARSEKDKGLSGMPDRETNYGKNLGSSDKGTISNSVNSMKNNHPTVKPVKLMAYLIVLGSRPGDVVCDPFGGSFTTPVAAEVMGRKWIVVEKEKSSYDIGVQRIKEELRTPRLF